MSEIARLNQSSRQGMIPTLFQNRDVLRAGWLKYIPFAERASLQSLVVDEHKFWVVFAVYDGATPYLEFYKKRQNFTLEPIDGPVSKHSLIGCQHISTVISPMGNYSSSNQHYEFMVTLSTHIIRLASDTNEVMFDWIDILKTKLISMNILKPTENLYTKPPVLGTSLFNNCNTQTNVLHRQLPAEPGINQLYESIFNPNSIVNNFEQLSLQSNVPLDEGPPPYIDVLIRSETNQNENQNGQEGNIQATSVQSFSITFREAQVDKLRKEMEMVTELNLTVRKKDCQHAVAFVDIQTFGIFVAGWKQKNHPHLHSTFHIGDQLININGVAMESASHARHFIKQCSQTLDIGIRRIPFGQVFCLKRSYDGEDLGIIRERGTAEIKFVIPNGIASKSGLLPKCSFYYDEENADQNWCLTEINNRPLNLFFKNDEIADRLNAIGKEISILVQPYNFVRRLRKQLKCCKNYKDYIVQ